MKTITKIGYLVWVDCDNYYEPEGTVFFDHEPHVGERVKLCDGAEYSINRVNHNSLEAWVKAT